jgi:hypothetical protein
MNATPHSYKLTDGDGAAMRVRISDDEEDLIEFVIGGSYVSFTEDEIETVLATIKNLQTALLEG